MNKNLLPISSAALLVIMNAVSFTLVCASFSCQVLKYKLGYQFGWFLPFIDISLEQNLPTFWTVLLLLFICLLLGIVTLLNILGEKEYTAKWLVLTLGFLYMAYDEGFHVHEGLVAMIRPMLWEGRLGVFYYAWVIPGIIVVFLLLLYFLSFIIFLRRRTRNLFLAAACVYLAGCIGMELVGGWYDELYGMHNLKYNLLSSIEEGLEMGGLAFFIYALLDYLKQEYGEISFEFH